MLLVPYVSLQCFENGSQCRLSYHGQSKIKCSNWTNASETIISLLNIYYVLTDSGFWPNSTILTVADKAFGPHTSSQEVYEVAAKPVVKAAMEGINGKSC